MGLGTNETCRSNLSTQRFVKTFLTGWTCTVPRAKLMQAQGGATTRITSITLSTESARTRRAERVVRTCVVRNAFSVSRSIDIKMRACKNWASSNSLGHIYAIVVGVPPLLNEICGELAQSVGQVIIVYPFLVCCRGHTRCLQRMGKRWRMRSKPKLHA